MAGLSGVWISVPRTQKLTALAGKSRDILHAALAHLEMKYRNFE
jgi:hypothetical protein